MMTTYSFQNKTKLNVCTVHYRRGFRIGISGLEWDNKYKYYEFFFRHVLHSVFVKKATLCTHRPFTTLGECETTTRHHTDGNIVPFTPLRMHDTVIKTIPFFAKKKLKTLMDR